MKLVDSGLFFVDQVGVQQLFSGAEAEHLKVLFRDDPVVPVLVAQAQQGHVESERFIRQMPNLPVPGVLVGKYEVRSLILVDMHVSSFHKLEKIYGH